MLPLPLTSRAPAPPAVEQDLRREMAAVARKLYDRGYVVATDGNISARLPDGRLLVTPTGWCKGDLGPADLVLTDMRGAPLDPGAARPSAEIRMHVAAYEERPDAWAAVHAHPRTAVAFTLAGADLASCILPEVVIGVGRIGVAPYATPTTQQAADAVRGLVRTCDAIVLDRHGSLTVGRTLARAFYNLERLEWAAEVTKMARDLGGLRTLPKDEVERLLQVREKYTGQPRRLPCNLCGACLGLPPGAGGGWPGAPSAWPGGGDGARLP